MKKNVPEPNLNFSIPQAETDLLEMIDEVSKNEIIPRRAEMDAKEIFPHEIFQKYRDAGFFGTLFGEEYGGLGWSMIAIAKTCQIVSKYCLGVATSFFGTKLGSLPIEIGGTKEQKDKYLPSIVSGEKICAFCLSEPNAGSDVPNISTIAEKKGDKYILNGTKQWITNAGEADIYTVFVATNKKRGTRGMSCFVLEKGMKGLSFGNLENKLGIRASHTRQVIMEDCEVPAENLLGLQPDRGFLHALATLNLSRPFVAACSVGVAQAAYEEAVRYTKERKQFKRSIISFQVIQHMLADMLVKLESASLLTYKACQFSQIEHPDLAKYSAIAKYHASEIAMQNATDALQMHGGYGFTKDYPIEKIFRDAKILAIYEGTSQIQKNEIGAYIIRDANKLIS